MSKKAPPNFIGEPGPLLHTARWQLGEFALDEGKRELSRAGVVIALEPKPFNMLMLLLRHPGELITKNDLMEALWTGRIVTENVLTNSVTKLRTALGDDQARIIRTVHGYGYRLEGNPQLVTEAPSVQAPEVSFAADSPVPHRPNWRLRRRIGRTGECWLAEQPMSGEWRVFKFAYQPKALSALKREVTLYRLLRQALEERAPIVDLLDWNFDEPPWFIETEYCELGSLQEYLDAQGGASKLPLEKRLDITAQLADALAAVHSVGILHKDLKPANVLVVAGRGDEVRIRLADFGSGRLLDHHQLDNLAITRLGFTQFAEGSTSSTSGTPLYFAPEVLSGQPPTLKSDVYALGVILYQLVVGDMRRLFAPGWETGVDDELLRDDIAAAAAGNPAARLGDAQLLAQRLRKLALRHIEAERLAGERSAAKATALALQRSEARRAGLRIAAATLLLGVGVSLALLWRTHQAEREARNAAERATTVRDFILRDMLGKLSTSNEPVQGLTVRDLLEHASQQATARFIKQSELESLVRYQLGMGFEQLGLHDLAAPQLSLAVAKGYGWRETDPAEYGLMLSKLMLNSLNLGSYQQRQREFAAERQVVTSHLGPRHPISLELVRATAIGEEHVGNLLGARKLLLESLDIAENTTPPDLKTLSALYRSLGRVEDWLGNYTSAIAMLDKSLNINESINGKNHATSANIMVRQAFANTASGKYLAAEKKLSAATLIAKRWEPQPSELSISIVMCQVYTHIEKGDIIQAKLAMKHLSEITAAAPAEVAAKNFFENYLQARLLLAEQKPQQAYEAATLALRKTSSLGRYRVAAIIPEITHLQAEASLAFDLKQSQKFLQALESSSLVNFPQLHPHWAEHERLLGLMYKKNAQPDSAEKHLSRSLEIFSKTLGESHPRTLAVKKLCQQFKT